RDELFTFLRQPGLDATNWRAELAIRFGVILRKVWGGSRTWAGARAQAVLMSVWRTCWQQGRSALDVLSQLLGAPRWPWPCPRDPPRQLSRRDKPLGLSPPSQFYTPIKYGPTTRWTTTARGGESARGT